VHKSPAKTVLLFQQQVSFPKKQGSLSKKERPFFQKDGSFFKNSFFKALSPNIRALFPQTGLFFNKYI